MLTIEELRKNIKGGNYKLTAKAEQLNFKQGHIFDEEQTVRWNQNKVSVENARIREKRARIELENERKKALLNADLLNFVMSKGYTEDAANIILSFTSVQIAYNLEHRLTNLVEFTNFLCYLKGSYTSYGTELLYPLKKDEIKMVSYNEVNQNIENNIYADEGLDPEYLITYFSDHIFDLNQSVVWNREKVLVENEKIEIINFAKRRDSLSYNVSLLTDLHNYLTEYEGFTYKQADAILSYANHLQTSYSTSILHNIKTIIELLSTLEIF